MSDYSCSTMALPPLHVQVVLLGNLRSSSVDDRYEYAVSNRWINMWETASDGDGTSLPPVYMDKKDNDSDDDTSGNVYIPESKFTILISWHSLHPDHQLRRRLIQGSYVPLDMNATDRCVFMNKNTDFLRLNVHLLENIENEKLAKSLDFFAWDNIEHLERQVRRMFNVPRNVPSRLWLLVERSPKKPESFGLQVESDTSMGSFILFLCSLFPEIKALLFQRKYRTSMQTITSAAGSPVLHPPVYPSCNSQNTTVISNGPTIVYPAHKSLSTTDIGHEKSMMYEDFDTMKMKLNIAVERMPIANPEQLFMRQNTGSVSRLDSTLQSIETLAVIKSDWEDALHNVLEECSAKAEVQIEQTKAELMQAACSFIHPKITELDNIKSQYEEKLARICEREKQVSNNETELAEKQSRLNKNFEKFTMDLEFLKGQKEELAQHIDNMEKQNEICETKICLNVGDRRFMTSTLTLTKHPDSMLGIMFSGRHPLSRESDGSVFIDRDGSHFGHILNYLRDGDLVKSSLPTDQPSLNSIKREAEFYQISELVNIVDIKLKN